MAKVQDVAAFFIDLAQKQNEHGMGDLATNMRVNKLLYFAQGWHLARYGRPLFDAPLEAWQYGPVVPEVYNRYNAFGAQGIIIADTPDESAFTREEYALLLDVATEYDNLSTGALMRITHEAGAPWSRVSHKDKEQIPLQSIKEHFEAQPPLLSFDDILDAYPVEVL